MNPTVFQPLTFGNETFQVLTFDENSFVMKYLLEPGGFVPPHFHPHMDEHFKLVKGEMKFTVKGESCIKKAGEEIMVPKAIIHSIANSGKTQVEMTVTYSPCADTHRMFEILAVLNESRPGSMLNMMQYFYMAPRLGLKEFSVPQPAFALHIINGIVTIWGKLAGWEKLVPKFKQ